MNKQELVAAMATEAGLTKADSERAARICINPLTKKPLKIAAKKVAQFKAGKALSELVNCRNIDCYALGGSYESADMVYKNLSSYHREYKEKESCNDVGLRLKCKKKEK